MRRVARRVELVFGGVAVAVVATGIAVVVLRSDGSDGADARKSPERTQGLAEAPVKVGVPTEVPRRSELIDTDYQFKLVAPGPEWEVFDRAESDPIWFGQLAVMESANAMVQVSIERTGDIPVTAGADRIAVWLGRTELARRPVAWLGHDTIELDFAAEGGEARRERVFVRDGLLHDVSLIRSAAVDSWEALDVESMWNAFSLLGGTPRATTPPFGPRDRLGIGWRVEAGRWESAIAGISVTPPTGWRLMTGRALGVTELDVELANDACGCYVSLTSFVGIPPAADPNARTLTIDTLGGSYPFVASTEPNAIYQIWDATIMIDGTRLALQAWYPKAHDDLGVTELRRALAALTVMPGIAREALARALLRPRFEPAVIGPSWVLRNGAYADYQWGLVWKRTPGFWRISTGTRANELLVGGIMVATEPRMRIVLFVGPDDQVLEPGLGVEHWFTEHIGVAMTPIDLTASNPRLRPGVEGVWTDDHGQRHVHRVMPLIGDAHSFRIHIAGSPEAIRSHEAEIADALAGLDTRTITATEERGGTFVDRRWGYQIALPPGWKMTERSDAGESLDRTWDLADRELIAVIVETGRGGPHERFTQMRSRLTASAAVGLGTAPRPIETASVLAGEDAVKLTWTEDVTVVTVLLAEHDGVLFTLFTRGTAETLETARRAFRFVEKPD
jgi:hypothetical protein